MKWNRPKTLVGWIAAAVFLALPSASALAQPMNFSELQLAVNDFRAGMRPDIVAASCTNLPGSPSEGPDEILCLEGNSPILGSGWDIVDACFAIFDSGRLIVGFNQAGVAGDGDGDGDPNVGSFQFDSPGIGPNEGYDATIDVDLDGTAEFRFSVNGVNVGGHNLPGLDPSGGVLRITQLPGLGNPLVIEPSTSVVLTPAGSYKAGTSGPAMNAGGAPVSHEVILEINDVANLPGRPLDTNRFRLRVQAGSLQDTCFEDPATFLVLRPSISIDKTSRAQCVGSAANPDFVFSATYTVTNDGAQDFTDMELVDTPSSVPAGLLTTPPTCSAGGNPLAVTSLGGGAFRANLGALPASDLDVDPSDGPFPQAIDIDCGSDGVLDPSCGRVVVQCSWDAVPVNDLDSATFNNVATATGLDGAARIANNTDSAQAQVLAESCPQVPGGGMRKEHEGVGFDNQLNLAGTLPLGAGFTFGSAVNPNDGPDASLQEDFTALGALEVIGRPGTFANIPRIPPGKAGVKPQLGIPALFEWRILVTADVDDVASLDVACSVCAEKAWRDDHSPIETFAGPTLPGDLVTVNRPVALQVFHECGPVHPPTEVPCGGPLQAVTIPGLARLPSNIPPGNFVEFLGCKPKYLQLDPVSSGTLILPGDILIVQIGVPGSERARVFTDATSCEVSYLTTTPDAP